MQMHLEIGLVFGTSALLSVDPKCNRRVGYVSASVVRRIHRIGFIFNLNTINDT